MKRIVITRQVEYSREVPDAMVRQGIDALLMSIEIDELLPTRESDLTIKVETV